MHRDALSHVDLFCTACRTFEGGVTQHKLVLVAGKTIGDYVLTGHLACSHCGHRYEIVEGVPCMLPGLPSDPALTEQYLDAHYGDLNAAYWDGMGAALGGRLALDAGCSVGRITFEAARRGFAVGMDVNFDQLRLAASFQRTGRVAYSRHARALHSEPVESAFVPSPNALFILADLHDPPFGADTFDLIAALNLIDSVKHPLTALGQADAMLKPGGRLLLSSPYAWDPRVTDEWLESEDVDPHEFVRSLLAGDLIPQCEFSYRIIEEKTGIPWRLRRHDTQHFLYYSDLIVAEKR